METELALNTCDELSILEFDTLIDAQTYLETLGIVTCNSSTSTMPWLHEHGTPHKNLVYRSQYNKIKFTKLVDEVLYNKER